MFEFEKLCRDVENIDPLTYSVVITERSARIIAGLSAITEDGIAGLAIYTSLILGAVVSDGVFAEDEYLLIKPMLDLALGHDVTIDEAYDVVRFLVPDTKEYKKFVDAVTDLFGEISDDLKTDIVVVCLLVCAADGKISHKEKKWLKQLIK